MLHLVRPAALLALLVLGVSAGADGSASRPAACASDPHDPLGARQALRALDQARRVPLTVHASCAGVGSHPRDATVGDYMNGFLASMNDGSNRIEASCVRVAAASGSCSCTIWMKHRDADDEWAWGLAFTLDARGRLERSSIRCLGGG